ncbi:hypothetical protein [Cupriavidus necator]|uniref:hypothetical protein n=1 Tax=Cupriavidus necator TaxID=106590 RepID=UPI00278B1CCD|nr:hypothetical protein [Cupriavidus necator]MDQ0138503.1 hypothetical protein [Cupriavidus necator]
MQFSHRAHASSPASQFPTRPAAAATQALTPMERLMDLLHEVRQFSRQLQRSAREAAAHADQRTYADALRALLDSRMQCADARMRIVCYACAAELGLSLELEAEHCRQAMSGGLGFPLRVLFWAAHRRMRAARRSPGAWLQPQR